MKKLPLVSYDNGTREVVGEIEVKTNPTPVTAEILDKNGKSVTNKVGFLSLDKSEYVVGTKIDSFGFHIPGVLEEP